MFNVLLLIILLVINIKLFYKKINKINLIIIKSNNHSSLYS